MHDRSSIMSLSGTSDGANHHGNNLACCSIGVCKNEPKMGLIKGGFGKKDSATGLDDIHQSFSLAANSSALRVLITSSTSSSENPSASKMSGISIGSLDP